MATDCNNAKNEQTEPSQGPCITQKVIESVKGRMNLVVMAYADKTVVLVTSLDKIGYLIQVHQGQLLNTTFTNIEFHDANTAEDSRDHLVDHFLLGPSNPIASTFAIEISHRIKQVPCLKFPVLVGLGIYRFDDFATDDDVAVLRSILQGLESMIM